MVTIEVRYSSATALRACVIQRIRRIVFGTDPGSQISMRAESDCLMSAWATAAGRQRAVRPVRLTPQLMAAVDHSTNTPSASEVIVGGRVAVLPLSG